MTDLVEVLRGRDEHTAQCAADEIERIRKRAENLERELDRASVSHERLADQRDELLAAARYLIEAKGRFHTELSYKRLAEVVAKAGS